MDYKKFIQIERDNISAFEEERGMMMPVYQYISCQDEDVRKSILTYCWLFKASEEIDLDKIEPQDKWSGLINNYNEQWYNSHSFSKRPLVTSHPDINIPSRIISEFINNFYNLRKYEDDNKIFFKDYINENKVVKKIINKNKEIILIDRRYLLQFLKDKDLSLIIGNFEGRQVKDVPEDSNIHEREKIKKDGNSKYRLSIFQYKAGGNLFWNVDFHEIKVVNPEKVEFISINQELKERRRNITFKDIRGDTFSANKADIPSNALKPVFFSEDLLDRYNRDKKTTVNFFSKQGGRIEWEGFTSIRFYQNEAGEVYIIAKDIPMIPSSELGFWSDQNKIPDSGIPEEAWKNYFKGEFVDSKPIYQIAIDKFKEFKEITDKKLNDSCVKKIRHKDEEVSRPSLNTKKSLFETMKNLNILFNESFDEEAIKIILKKKNYDIESIEGSKSAFYELVEKLEDRKVAKKLLDPFNVIYDLRQEDSHTKGNRERAFKILDVNEEDVNNWRELYDKTMILLIEKLGRLNSLAKNWKNNEGN